MLAAAFDLLIEPAGPVLRDFPETIAEQSDVPAACPLPPSAGDGHPAAAEARGLRAAYNRTLARRGTTDVGRATTADGIPAAVEALARLAAGESAVDAQLPGDPAHLAQDIRAYYEEAGLALVDHVPAARQVETWFFHHTAAGDVLHRAQRALKDAGADAQTWQYMMPFTQRRKT